MPEITFASGDAFTYKLHLPSGDQAGQSRSQGNAQNTIVYDVEWSVATSFLANLLGGVKATSSGGGSVESWLPPHQSLFVTGLYCSGASLRGLGKPQSETIPYERAIVTATYERPTFDPVFGTAPIMAENLRFASDQKQIVGETYVVPANSNVFNDDLVNIGTSGADEISIAEGTGKIMPTMEYELRIFGHPFPPWNASAARVGKVNASPFSPLRLNFLPGRLLYDSMDTEPVYVYDFNSDYDILAWNIVHRFKFRSIPWNLDLLPVSDGQPVGWVQPKRKNTNELNYKTADFAALVANGDS